MVTLFAGGAKCGSQGNTPTHPYEDVSGDPILVRHRVSTLRAFRSVSLSSPFLGMHMCGTGHVNEETHFMDCFVKYEELLGLVGRGGSQTPT